MTINITAPKLAYLSLAFCLAFAIFAFKPAQEPTRTQGRNVFMEVTAVESIIAGGTGRSRLFVTEFDGKQQEFLLENLYSLVGIKMEHIKLNDRLILEKLNAYAAEGWEIAGVTTGVQSPSDSRGQGIYMTRYLLKKTID
jgi:hypothetical protein